MRTATFMAIATLAATPALAHIVVAPQQSPVGASPICKVRVH